MECIRCKSNRVLRFKGKCSDAFFCNIENKELHGYVPRDISIGGGDYVKGDLCLNCGQMQGTWPLPPSKLETE